VPPPGANASGCSELSAAPPVRPVTFSVYRPGAGAPASGRSMLTCPVNAPYPTISAFLKQRAISFFAVSGLSEPCTEFF